MGGIGFYPTLLVASAALTLGYVVCLAVYRLFFDPLSKIPGPKLLAVSDFPHSYKNLLKGDWYKYMLELHEKYGPIVRVGPNRLSIDGGVGWSEVYGHKRAGRPEFGRDLDFFDPAKEGYKNIFNADRESHRRQRRLMAHAFSDNAMYSQEPIIKGYVDLFISRMRQRATDQEPVDIVKWFNFTTFDIIGDLAFADSFHCLDSSDMHPWVAIIFSGIKASSHQRFLLQNPLLGPLVRWMFGSEMERRRKEHLALAAEKTKRRIDLGPAGDDRKDFLAYMLRYNDEKGMSENEILSNSSALIVAGSETTATALSGLTYFLTQYPQAMTRLIEEIRSSFNSEEDITMRSTLSLQYMHACIEEGLRVYPPVVESPWRMSPGDYVDGKWIPEGTKTTIYQWATYHSSHNFVQPFAFRPERWLPSSHPFYDPIFDHDNKKAFAPFSFGPRNCLGMNLAYSELRLIVARFFWNFDVELMKGLENWPDDHKAYIIWEKTPLMVRLHPVARDCEKSGGD